MAHTRWRQLEVAGARPMMVHEVRPADGPARGAVVVLHELFGVNDDIRSVMDDLALDGYMAVAPEMFHRTAPDRSTFAKDDIGRADAFGHLNAVTRDDVVADVRAVLAHMAAEGHASAALLGFSVGGHMAVIAASALPIDLTIACSPGWLATTDVPMSRPEPTIARVGGIVGRLVIVLGAADHVVPAHERERVRAALAEAGGDSRLEVLHGVGHAFFWPGGAAYDAQARSRTWGMVVGELEARFPVAV